MVEPKLIRQGDLLFEPADQYSESYIRSQFKKGDPAYQKDGIIQEGEATGHHHRVDPLTADVFRPQFGQPIIVVGGAGADVMHEEHAPVHLEPDTIYNVRIAREFDPVEGARQVAD
jgi:hypothetical protein